MAAPGGTQSRRVVVTGLGVVSPVGQGKRDFFDALLAGRSGIASISSFDATGFPVRIAAEVKGFDPAAFADRKMVKRMDRYAQLGVAAGMMAYQDASLSLSAEELWRSGVMIGSGIGGLRTFQDQTATLLQRGPERVSPFFIPMMIPNMASAHLSMALGLKGPISATCTACAASTNALGDAFEVIRRGDADIMLAGGAEAPVTETGLAGFAALRALSTRNDYPLDASRPFDAERDGFVMGEGAAVMVLEERERALRRGAHLYAEFLGYGMSADAFHLTEPDESGESPAAAVRMAAAKAGIEASQLDYINAHGTSTPLGDAMETRAIRLALGAAADRVLVSSTKSMIGHCLGAAGAIEAVATVMSIAEGVVHPTINLTHPDPACDLDFVPLVARRASIRYAASNSFGFGGINASVVFGEPGD